MKIGIIREGKIPIDKRVALSPAACKEVVEKFPGTEIYVQSSKIRCYKDQEYVDAGFELKEDVSTCDILLGIKEVPMDDLIPQRTYLFFSHTIKKQSYNRDLLNALLRKQIKMVDYEALTDKNGVRVIAFGRYAGLVGAYNGILAYGKRHELFELKPAHKCFDLAEMKTHCRALALPAIKIALTGNGRVSNGAAETLNEMGVEQVSAEDFLANEYDKPVFVQLKSEDYNVRKDGQAFDTPSFFTKGEEYESAFKPYAQKADVLIAGAYWDIKQPVLFTKEDMRGDDFKIKVIADITCDIEGSIPSTKQPSTIDDPLYDYNPDTEGLQRPLSGAKNVTVMAVDNLPNELPRDASDSFGRQLIDFVLPNLLNGDAEGMIANASITEGGKLTEKFSYLQDFADGKE
ncbi:MAG: NAD(P)-dependent oxidoreductase [Flammeovirgaceae bacterium]